MMNYEKLHIEAKMYVYVGAHLGAAEMVDMPISEVRGNHEENGIPFCTVTIGTGRDATLPDNWLGLSPFHLKEKLMRLPSRAVIRLRVRRLDMMGSSNQVWPDDWFTAFEGWISDVIPSVSMGSRSAVVRVTHWVSDLDFSSPFSEDVFPNTPGDFLFNASTVQGTGLNRVVVGSTALSKAIANFSPQTIVTDTWDDGFGGGIRNFLYATADERLFNWQQIANFTGSVMPAGDFPRVNVLMQRALSYFEPYFDEEINSYMYEYGTPLSLRNDIVASAQLSLKIRSMMTDSVYNTNVLGQTIWDRLVSSIAPQFMFSVIPMVDRILTVPYTPWLNRTYTRIATDEFEMLNYTSTVRRPVKAVAVIGGYASATGLRSAQQAGGSIVSNRKVLGYYEPTPSPVNGSKNGMTMYVEAPGWINDLFMQGFSSLTAPLSGNIPLAANPKARVPRPAAAIIGGAAGDAIAAGMADKTQACETLANALAKATYLQEVTKMKQAVISCNLRFDIGPGSSILIQSAPDPMVEALLNTLNTTDTDLIGRVARVTWSINIGANGNATTSTVFHIAYLRTVEENNDEAFASDEHPLWRNIWTGSPLIALPEFSQ